MPKRRTHRRPALNRPQPWLGGWRLPERKATGQVLGLGRLLHHWRKRARGRAVASNQLVDAPAHEGMRASFFFWNDAAIVATTGWTTANLSNGMDAAQVDTATWDLVSLLIGVNNQYQGLPVDDYANEFDVLLDRESVLDGRSSGSGLCGEHSRLRVHPVWGIQSQHLGRAADIQRHLPRPNTSCGHQPFRHHAHFTTTSGNAWARGL